MSDDLEDAGQEPLSASPFNFGRLTKDEWEELTFLVSYRENPKVVRLRAPDGGLDTLLPSLERQGKADQGWQAKHFPGPIRWDQCEESLDRAVEIWEPRQVTFTFPRDLTKDEHTKFEEKLASRHEGVTVDYWTSSKASADMLADDAGARIARRFFGPADPIGEIERATRAGGDLSRPEHALEREFAVDEFVQNADPHFQWVIYKLQAGEADPAQTPGAIMRLEFSKGQSRLLADAVPRTKSSAEHYGPKVTLVTDDSPEGKETRRLLGELLRGGGKVSLRDGFKVAMERVPKPFGDLISEPFEGQVLIKSVPATEPWYMTIEVSSNLGQVEMDLDLDPIDPTDEWVSAWRGSRGGLTLEIRTRWSVNEGRGQTALQFHFSGSSTAPLADRALAVRLIVALHGDGTMRFIDRTGDREPLEQELAVRALAQEIADLNELLGALLEIEQASGKNTPPIPDELPLKNLDKIVRVGKHLREGGILYRMKEAKLTGDSKLVASLSKSASDITVSETASVNVFGEEIPVAKRIMNLPPMVTKEVRRVPGEEDLWEIVLLPLKAEEMEVWAEMRPLEANGG